MQSAQSRVVCSSSYSTVGFRLASRRTSLSLIRVVCLIVEPLLVRMQLGVGVRSGQGAVMTSQWLTVVVLH